MKEIIKHNLNLKLENKFSLLNVSNTFNKNLTVNISRKKNAINVNKNKDDLKYIKKNKIRKNYIVNKKNDKIKIVDYSASIRNNKKILQKFIRVNTTDNFKTIKLNINNKNETRNNYLKKLKLKNYCTSPKTNTKYIPNINLTYRKDNKLLLNNDSEYSIKKVNSEIFKKKLQFTPKIKEVLYIKLYKNNILSNAHTEKKEIKIKKNKNVESEKDNNNINSIKKKLLILVDDFKNKDNIILNNTEFSLRQKTLIDRIRTIKKLTMI